MASPITDLFIGTGRWMWFRDDGFREYVSAELGSHVAMASNVMETLSWITPQQWYTYMEDGKWQCIVFNSQDPGGEVQLLEEDSVHDDESEDANGVKTRTTTVSSVEEDGTEHQVRCRGSRGDAQFDMMTTRRVVGDELHFTFKNLTKELEGTRVYKRIPHFTVANNTGECVTLRLYNPSDFLYIVSRKQTVVPVGKSILDFTTLDMNEMQAVFTMQDNRKWTKTHVKAGETCVLDLRNFA